MKQKYYLLSIIALLIFGSCSSGLKQLERGNYDEAVHLAVKRLQQKPGHSKATYVLKKAYRVAVEEHMTNIERYDKSSDRFKWTHMAAEYEAIDRLNSIIRMYPYYNKLVKLIDVNEELNLTRKEAAGVHFKRGIELLDKGSREAARQAYDEFHTALYFDPANQLTEDKLNESREAGTVNIVLDFPENEPNAYLIPTKDLYYAVQNASRSIPYTFLRIIDPEDGRYKADEIIQLRFDQLLIGNVFLNQQSHRISKDSVLLGNVKINDSTHMPVYGPVHAELLTYSKQIQSEGVLLLQRIDPLTGTILNRTRIPSSYNWTGEWASFKGDERALNDQQYDLTTLQEPFPPAPQWMFVQMSKPLLDQTIRILQDTYRYLR